MSPISLGRQFWVVIHRWAGLSLVLFLTVAGATGTLLPFYDDLEALTAPSAHIVTPPYVGAAPLETGVLRQRVLAQFPNGRIDYWSFKIKPKRTVVTSIQRYDLKTGMVVPWSAKWDQALINPYTGKVVVTRKWGDITQGTINLMPFLYQLHYSLALGTVGQTVFGIAALIWTLDCFVGFYLTFPIRKKRKDPEDALQRLTTRTSHWFISWKPAWTVRWKASSYKLNFDLHRAGGLWIWPLLLVFAWSSVAFNLNGVYTPVMKLFAYHDAYGDLPALPAPLYNPDLDFEAARVRGNQLARSEMLKRHLTYKGEDSLYAMPSNGLYAFSFSSGRDFTNEGGRSTVFFDGNSGRVMGVELPSGQHGGNTFTNWIYALHMAEVFGLPYRILVSFIGGLVTMLSITGVVIWMKKRSARIGRTGNSKP